MFDTRQDVSPNHVFQGERMFFQKAIYQMFDKKIQGKTLFKSNILYIIEIFLKHNYLKWSFILDFKLKG
jgi:cytochrome c oxidase subunit IV